VFVIEDGVRTAVDWGDLEGAGLADAKAAAEAALAAERPARKG
jgi:hypothetical protein